MKFEDILPAVRAGRLARRKCWSGTECLGCTEYGMRSGSANDLSIFSEFDRNSSYRGFSRPGVEKDILAYDWELVPEIQSQTPKSYYIDPILTELAVRQAKVDLLEAVLADLHNQFGIAAIQAYRTGRTELIMDALDVGIAWLIKARAKE